MFTRLCRMAGAAVLIAAAASHYANAGQDDLGTTIPKLFPGAEIVPRHEIDSVACAPLSDSPSVVRADLNGDGRDDYGVLLRLKFTGKERVWQGKSLKQAEFAFVVLVNQGNGTFKPLTGQRYTNDIPTAVSLDLRKPGMVRDRQTGKDVRLPRTGIMMSFCERSAVIYYLSGDRLRSIQFAD